MKTIFSLAILILLACTINISCKKTAVDNSSLNNTIPVPTPVGTPVGNPVTVTIGSSGGSILSADSMVELQFPSGALSSNTQITIQPIINNAPNGLGNAIRFSPEGLKFSTPINLVFHYQDTLVAGTLPDLMGIAFQDSSGIWFALEPSEVDSVNKTISVAINHFSDWTIFTSLRIQPPNPAVRVSKSIELVIAGVDLGVGLKGYPLLSPLVPMLPKKFSNQTWLVNNIPNGNAAFGTISTLSSKSRLFTAPSKATQENNPALVRVFFKGIFSYLHNKTKKDLELHSKIQIIDYGVFLMELVDDYINMHELPTGQKYWDKASVVIEVWPSENTATVSAIRNYSPSVLPEQAVFGGCTFTWIPDSKGELYITGGDAKTIYPSSRVTVNLINSGVGPKFQAACIGGTSFVSVYAGKLPTFYFDIQDSVRLYGSPHEFYYKVTRIF